MTTKLCLNFNPTIFPVFPFTLNRHLRRSCQSIPKRCHPGIRSSLLLLLLRLSPCLSRPEVGRRKERRNPRMRNNRSPNHSHVQHHRRRHPRNQSINNPPRSRSRANERRTRRKTSNPNHFHFRHQLLNPFHSLSTTIKPFPLSDNSHLHPPRKAPKLNLPKSSTVIFLAHLASSRKRVPKRINPIKSA